MPVGIAPIGIAISPNGQRAAVANAGDGLDPGSVNFATDSVSVIDLATRAVTNAFGVAAEFIAITPDGNQAYISKFANGGILPFSLPAGHAGPAIAIGEGIGPAAVVPNQAPGGVVRDRARSARRARHAERRGLDRPGRHHRKYTVTLTLTDTEGCSTAFVFTGHTAYCSGQPTAALTRAVVVAFPGVRLKCPASAAGGCGFKLRAVAVKGRGDSKRVSRRAHRCGRRSRQAARRSSR